MDVPEASQLDREPRALELGEASEELADAEQCDQGLTRVHSGLHQQLTDPAACLQGAQGGSNEGDGASDVGLEIDDLHHP